MDSFLDFLVRQKKLALVFTIGLIVLGLIALKGIQRDQFPAVDFEVVNIYGALPGGSPEDIEKNLTNPIEDELGNISGIDTYTSQSREGRTRVEIKLSQDVDDKSEVKQEIRNAINGINSFPDEVDQRPRVIDRKTSRTSILKISLGSKDYSYEEIRDITDDIAESLEMVDGVSEVVKDGYRDREIQVTIDPVKLNQFKLSLPEVLSILNKRNNRYTAGSNNSDSFEKNIVVLADYQQSSDIGDVVLKSTFDGPIVKLNDVATIEESSAKEETIVRVNGNSGFTIRVRKQANADVIDTVDLVKKELTRLNKKYDNKLEMVFSDDKSRYVRNRLEIVTNNGILGLILVLVVLGVFLSFKTAFWVAMSLPVSLLGSVFLLGVSGETINLVSLAAMILVLGIVVDDSIIVAESIHHYKQKGEDKFKATVHGFKRVILPVTTTILTTIIAFSAMFMMSGTMGKFIYVIPLVVIFALVLSFLECSIALPAHLAHAKEKHNPKNWFIAVEKWFSGVISKVLNYRYYVVGIFTALLVVTLLFAKENMKFVLFPEIGVETIIGRMTMHQGSSVENTSRKAEAIDQMIQEVVGKDIVSLTTQVGQYFAYKSRFTIELKPPADREKDSKDIIKELNKRAKKIGGMEKLRFSGRRPGPPQGEDIEINLISPDNEQRKNASNRLVSILKNIKGLDDIERDDEPGKDRVEVQIDFEKLSRLNIDFSIVKQYLRAAFQGIDTTDIRQGENDVNFRVYVGSLKNSEEFIGNIKIANRKGKLIPLSEFVSTRELPGEPDMNHYNGQRTTKISASVNDEVITTLEAMDIALNELNLEKKFPKVRAISEGGAKETNDSMADFKEAFILAIFAIYILLVLLFNSFTQPALILAAVPFSIIGVVWAFFLHGDVLSFFAMLGTLALVGVIVNDSLVLVSHLNYLKEKEGNQYVDPKVWIIEGTKDRLRAVVLTTLTTLAGVLPLAYGIGGTDFILQPMALSLGYGLLFGTLMTLVLLPSMYLMNYEFIQWATRLYKSKFKRHASGG
jgi:multidrug efflux pump subunit AcrB